MAFVLAFLVGGLLAAVFQVISMITRIETPKLLIIAFAIGAVLSALGVCDVLGAVGGGGFMITLIGAAQAIYNSVMALFGGAWTPLCIVTVKPCRAEYVPPVPEAVPALIDGLVDRQ